MRLKGSKTIVGYLDNDPNYLLWFQNHFSNTISILEEKSLASKKILSQKKCSIVIQQYCIPYNFQLTVLTSYNFQSQ